jgi:hypothetical protein
MQVKTYSCRGKEVGVKYRVDKSKPGQRCVTYHDVEPSKKKKG